MVAMALRGEVPGSLNLSVLAVAVWAMVLEGSSSCVVAMPCEPRSLVLLTSEWWLRLLKQSSLRAAVAEWWLWLMWLVKWWSLVAGIRLIENGSCSGVRLQIGLDLLC